ncbi:winged helix-turn-helix domain-containing protein [Lacipirellula sp.]|uniref:winged helix-turn-helix domain-containing protein n=1 Tax=Lacipirellula sp. TaxID=2691419 RepID=UPI003D0D3A0C
MAKKQASNEKKEKPAAAKPAKSAAKPAAAPKTLFNEPAEAKPAKAAKPPAPKKKAAAPAASSASVRPLTVEEIGHVAGEVWGALSANDNGGVTLAALKKAVAAPADHVLLALGWLAREDKVELDASKKTPTVTLK